MTTMVRKMKAGIALRAAALPAALMMLVALIHPAAAESVADFYKGKTIKVIVGLPPGGVYDISARMMARHLGDYIPGHPNLIVQNLPGAGGLVVANRLYADTSVQDGLTLAVIERSVAQLAVEGDPKAHFDPQKFNWLGSMSSYKKDAYLLLINANNPVKSVEDLQKPGASLRIGGGRAGSSNRFFALIAKDVLGLDHIKIIPGYPGATNIFLAMQTGEVDGQVIGYGSSMAGQRALWNQHKLRALLQFGRVDRHPDFPDVPTGRELAKTDKQRALVEFAELAFFMAMPMLAPPGIPEDRAQALQKAFMEMCNDPQFVADANKLGLEVSPVDAQGIKTLLTRAAATPKDVMEQYKKLTGS